MAIRLLTLLFVSTLMSVALLAGGIYMENNYFKITSLYLIDNSTRLFLCISLILLAFTLILTEYTLVLNKTKFKFLYILDYLLIGAFDIMFLVYSFAYLPPNDDKYRDLWSDKANSESVTLIEKTLSCCGYDDQLMSSSASCSLSGSLETCKSVISSETQYRKASALVFVFASILFEIYNIVLLMKLLKEKTTKTSEFEDLIESV